MSNSVTASSSKTTKSSTRTPLWIALIVVVVVLIVGFGLREASQLRYDHLSMAQKVTVITEDLRAPGDPSTVNQSSLGMAFQIRQQVQSDLQSGMTKNQILDAMVAKYGDGVLAVPRFRGFGVMTWFAPLLVAVIVLFGVFSFIRRSAARKNVDQSGISDFEHTVSDTKPATINKASSINKPSSMKTDESVGLKARLKDYL